MEETEYRALNPEGRALIKAAPYLPPHELPSEEYPLQLITGRTLYQFHTRTKTGRAPQLDHAAPDVWVELSAADAVALDVEEGDVVEVRTPRGRIEGAVRVSGIRPGVVFLPFHYGYWDTAAGHEPGGAGRAANELTLTDWDACSKQPLFKTAAARVTLVRRGTGPSPAPTTTASAPVAARVPATVGGPAAEVREEVGPPRAPGARPTSSPTAGEEEGR